MCTTGFIYYRECKHLSAPTHIPCRAMGRCNGARRNGMDFANLPPSERFVEVCGSCYACHFVRKADGSYAYVDW
ncbi:Uu.00g070070.m01.CDS01 [Anthostomella pinea]|uniref:Uu.00g070070.m01.CDS01 n=1 Tax=Anthostomella pinea TaxID=933095 RepID=A0AAI8VUL5_9PEZI|nr:Uu.00g070070.m01.CDS01 [Anthostomella pinea]